MTEPVRNGSAARIGRYGLPLALFAALIWVLHAGLGRNHEILPSPLIGRPVPQFDLPSLEEDSRRVSNAHYAGRMHLLNVWATWCVGCHQEHGTLMEVARRGQIPIVGVDWRDEREAARRWLAELGNPYVATAFDEEGRLAIDLGVYMAPESFLVDEGGRIVHKHFGPLTMDAWEREFVPLIRTSQ